MNNPEVLRLRTTELTPLPREKPEVFEGSEKIVRKMTDGSRIVAAKLYRTRHVNIFGKKSAYGPRINRQEAAEKEIKAYKRLRQTAMGIYIPEPYYLLQNEEGETIGLGVAWIEGRTLSRVAEEDRQQLLTHAEIRKLQKRIYTANKKGIYLEDDMTHNSTNIIITSNPDQRIFFAECSIFEVTPGEGLQPDPLRELELFYMRS